MKKEDRKQQIIEQAMEVFINNGYKGATTAKIAKKAGVSEVTLFRIFSSKQEIFLSGIRPVFIKSLKASSSIPVDLSKKEKIRYLLLERLSFMSDNRALIKLILQESNFLESIGSENLLLTIFDSFRTLIRGFAFEDQKESLVMRLITGSILSFLYLPETEKDEIEKYVEQLTCMIEYATDK